MDVWMIAGIAMLVVWAIGTFALTAPGWLHLLLTVGLSLVIWRIVARHVPDEPSRRDRR
jgi:hypothetical protein